MLIQNANEYGVITIDDRYMKQLLRDTLKPFEGKVWVAKYRGKKDDFIIKLGNIESLYELKSEITDKGMLIKIYLLIRFGTSVSKVSRAIFTAVSKALKEDLEQQIDNIEIHITGMMMTKGIAKRDIVVKYIEDKTEDING